MVAHVVTLSIQNLPCMLILGEFFSRLQGGGGVGLDPMAAAELPTYDAVIWNWIMLGAGKGSYTRSGAAGSQPACYQREQILFYQPVACKILAPDWRHEEARWSVVS